MPRSKVELFAATRQGSPFLPPPDRCRYQSRRRRGPGISGKMFSAPGLLARVERSGGRVRWRPKRSCCPWTPAFVVDALRTHLGNGTPAGLIFGTRTGTPFRRSNFRRQVWMPAVARSGLPPGCGSTTCGTATRRGSSRTGCRSTSSVGSWVTSRSARPSTGTRTTRGTTPTCGCVRVLRAVC